MLPASKYKHHHVPEHPPPPQKQQQQKKQKTNPYDWKCPFDSGIGEAKLPKVKTQRKKKFFLK